MSDEVKKAIENHHKGYNCAQAVACAFCKRFGKNEQDVFKVMEAFGFGMGAMETCGAVSGMVAVVGMCQSDGNLGKPATKKNCYKAAKQLINKFEEKNKSIICREIKGVETGRVLRSCDGCIEDAAQLIEDHLSQY
ncbi:MAG: C_GCAxxG_C_C family protein [Clostridiales bacterium]|nr:C_GCAxxG_C_C family protein [Clostridiales bacterium]